MAEEKNFENSVKRYLESIGIYPAGCPAQKMDQPTGWYFKVWGGGFQKSGIPDMIINAHGTFVAIELKAQKGKISPLQKLNIDRIRSTYGVACVLYPSGFDAFKADMQLVLEGTGGLFDIYK